MNRSESLTGVWHGLYSYPVHLEPVYFVATLIDGGSSLNGMTHEAAIGKSGAPLTVFASISGAREGQSVDFLKSYGGEGGWTHSVSYVGQLSADGLEIEGRWTIPGDWSGRFLMIRNAGATERSVREVYEKV